MRLAPAVLGFATDPATAIRFAGDSSRTTHASPECVDACRYFAGLIVGALQGRPKGELLSPMFSPVPGLWDREPLAPKVAEIAGGSFARMSPPQIRGSGYVIHTLEAALWAFHSTDSFRDGALAVVNLGEDADTTGAVFGQIAGAYYGEAGIPADWREKLAMRELIEQRAAELLELAGPG
jgi:ADP-ribosylglycohydrolase